jgi:predicted AAA+ superfamily ATPase
VNASTSLTATMMAAYLPEAGSREPGRGRVRRWRREGRSRSCRPGRSGPSCGQGQAAQSLAGRAHVVNVLPLSQRELDGHRERFIDLLWQDPERIPAAAVPACSRDEYVNRILAGGFPMILQRQTARARTSWFADYVDLMVMRDVLDIARIRQREALPRLLRQFAAQTGQLLNITKAGQAAGLESSTANRYATLLDAAFMIQRLPAWGETLGKRLSAHPKVHVIDSGLAGWLLGLSAAKINSRNPAALTEFGHLVETFAAGEILKQVSWADEVITASHFRTEAGDEVDLVLETWDGRVTGFEIKAGTRIKDPDLNGLRLLRDRLGDRFVGGFVLNLGELALPQGKQDRGDAAQRPLVITRPKLFIASNSSEASEPWEPNWEPTTTVSRRHQATVSLPRRS